MASTSQSVEANGRIVNAVQIVGDNNTVVIAGQPHLKLKTAASREQGASRGTERDLLISYRCTLELMGREREMAWLDAWLKSSVHFSVRCVTGKGGAGKTRLAMELLRQLPEGWQGGFLELGELERAHREYNASRWACSEHTLIVIDYAATFGAELRKWLLELSGASGGKCIRILLLERHASIESGWYADLANESQRTDTERDLAARFDPREPYLLPPIQGGDIKRRILQGTLNAYAELKEEPPLALPESGANPKFDAVLAGDAWNEPLTLMMAAVVSAVQGLPHVLSLSRADLAFKVAGREVGRLRRFTENKFFLLMAASATICKALNRAKAQAVIHGLPHRLAVLGLQWPQAEGVADVDSFVDLLERACGVDESSGTLTPVQPDIIGEAFVLTLLQEKSGKARLEEELQGQFMAFLTEIDLARALEFVVRAAQDFSHGTRPGAHENHAEPVAWINHLITVAEESHNGILLRVIDAIIPEHTVCLREAAVRVIRACIGLASGMPETLEIEQELARLYNNLANRLGDMGQGEAALEAANNAVERYTQLAAKNPDAYLPYLAVSLNNFAKSLSQVGRREAALEAANKAIERYTQLAAKNPDAYGPDLAKSLNNLAAFLNAVGQREAALEAAKKAVGMRTQLAAKNPDAYGPDLAMSLNNLAALLSAVGQQEAALEAANKAIERYTQLVAKNPDAYGPYLAGGLNNLATLLSVVGRREEALEAAKNAFERYTQLAARNPDVYGPDLAMSLNTLANRLSAVGQQEEALEAVKKAVEMRAQLAAKNPDAYGPELAMSLNDLANRLSAVGQQEAALEAAKNAYERYAQLAAKNPAAHGPDLAMSLNNLANRLSAVGQQEEALEAAKNAYERYTQLVAKNPAAYGPDLAMSLNNLALRLSAVGQREAALEAGKKAVERYTQLSAKNPDAYGPDLAMSLNTLANQLSEVGQREEALEVGKSAVEQYTQLAAKNPDAYGPSLATSLNNLANQLSEVGQREEALEVGNNAVERYTELAAKNPDAYGPSLAMSLNNLAIRLSELGQWEEALKVARKAVERYTQLAAKNADAYGPDLATSLSNLAALLSEMGKREEALEAAKKAVRMHTQLAAKNPDAYGPELATSYGAICQVYQGLERWEDAANAAKAGLAALSPLFERHPQAFAGLIAALCRDYAISCEQAACETDIDLLTPIEGVLQTLRSGFPSKSGGIQ